MRGGCIDVWAVMGYHFFIVLGFLEFLCCGLFWDGGSLLPFFG